MLKIVVFFNKIANDNFVEKITIFVNFFEKKMSSFGQFFDIQLAIFRRVRSIAHSCNPVLPAKKVNTATTICSLLLSLNLPTMTNMAANSSEMTADARP